MLTWTKGRLIAAAHREYYSADTLFPRRNKRHIIPSILLRNLRVLDWTFTSAKFAPSYIEVDLSPPKHERDSPAMTTALQTEKRHTKGASEYARLTSCYSAQP